MSDPFIGEIKMFASNFAPRGYSTCNGQIVGIQQNAALFALVGTTYGGNGTTTFGLPNFQGRSPVHWGTGAGMAAIVLGQAAGTETVTLLTSQMPAHSHGMALTVSTDPATSDAPLANGYLGVAVDTASAAVNIYGATKGTGATLALEQSSIVGGSQPFGVRNPYLAVTFIIALVGEYPTRN
ncbi:MAG: tail fiber protein [Paucimonas sp.]|jgi:microcystin-dependent protein|nr:tail fiber protein [Paucimonas sp.]